MVFRQSFRQALLRCAGAASVPIRRQCARSRTVHLRQGPIKSAPSRCRLRPAIRLTSAEASVTRRTISLGRSVLGASRTLGGDPRSVKAFHARLVANCGVFFSHRVKLRIDALARVLRRRKRGRACRPGRKEFAEPGTLSSTFPTNFPLPRSAPRGASSYWRPVLGAAALYANQATPFKPRPNESRAICERRSAAREELQVVVSAHA